MTIIRQNYFAPGDWNACCDRCAAKFKASALRKDWQGLMLCVRCWEPRHPQDFVRARPGPEPAPLPFTRSELAPVYVITCTVAGMSSLPDAAVADCWLADYVSPSFDPSVE